MDKDPQAVALAKKRWANKTDEEKRAHSLLMVNARKLKVKHDTKETKFVAVIPEEEMEAQAELEAKYGEQRSAQE